MPRQSIDHRLVQNYVVNTATGKPMKPHDIPVICEKLRFYREQIKMGQADRSRPDINLLPTLCSTLGITFHELFAIPNPIIKLSSKEIRLVERYRQLKPVY